MLLVYYMLGKGAGLPLTHKNIMSNEQKEQLVKSSKLIVLQQWQLIIIIVTFIASIGAYWNSTQMRLSELEHKTNEYKTKVDNLEVKINEISFNLKAFMEKYECKYIQLER